MKEKTFGTLDLKNALNDIKQDLQAAKDELKKEGQNAGDSIGDGFDDGVEETVRKIQASSIKLTKGFKDLSQKIKQQVQQLTTMVNGKDKKINIDFSDIDLNTDEIKKKIDDIVNRASQNGWIEFDVKGSEQQFKNLITLFTKYEAKLELLQREYGELKIQPLDISSAQKQMENLQKRLALIRSIDEISDVLGNHGVESKGSGFIRREMENLQTIMSRLPKQEQQVTQSYSDLLRVLEEIQGLIKPITDAFQNGGTAIGQMAREGSTSLDTLLGKLKELYTLMEQINTKPINVTQIMGGQDGSPLQNMQQQMAIARETLKHLQALFADAQQTLTLLGSNGQIEMVMNFASQLQELNLTDINKSIKGANTEIKLASVLAEMQDYIDQLIKINELRNQYNLGEWKDTFVPQQISQARSNQANVGAIQQEIQSQKQLNAIREQSVAQGNNTEVQQMWQLQAAIEAVIKAIGRKNAGFIKEGEIVQQVTAQEMAAMSDLVSVLVNGVIGALSGIKTQFAQAITLPPVDQSNLQTSLDSIYNKFVELRDKIGALEFNIAEQNIKEVVTTEKTPIVDSANITQKAVDGEAQSATDAAKQFVDAAKAKKEFVEANKQVAKSAEESEKKINEETKAAENFDKAQKANSSSKSQLKSYTIKSIGGTPISATSVTSSQSQDAINTLTITENLITKEVLESYKQDFEAIRKLNASNESKIKKAQAKLSTYMSGLSSKTGGMTQYLDGYSKLNEFKFTSTDEIDNVLVEMGKLESQYNNLTKLARRGMSSLNPFTNAVNDAKKIGNTFDTVRLKYESILNPTTELTENFDKLQQLLQTIQTEQAQMNNGTMDVSGFEQFMKHIGEFRELNNQIAGQVRNQATEEKNQVTEGKKQENIYKKIITLIKQRNKLEQEFLNLEDGSKEQLLNLKEQQAIQKQLHISGKQLRPTKEQKSELDRIRMRQEIETDNIKNNKIEEQKEIKASEAQKKHNEDLSEYIRLIQLRNSYEQKATKEEYGSDMNLSYLQEQTKVQGRIDAIGKSIVFTEKEQNQLNEIKLQQQMKLSEIVKRRAATMKIQNEFSGIESEFNKLENPSDELVKNFQLLQRYASAISYAFSHMDMIPDGLLKFTRLLGGYTRIKDGIQSDVKSGLVTEKQNRDNQKKTFNELVKEITVRDKANLDAAKQKDDIDLKQMYLDDAETHNQKVQALQKELTLTEEQEKVLKALSERHAILLKQINQENAAQDQKAQDKQDKSSFNQLVKEIKARDQANLNAAQESDDTDLKQMYLNEAETHNQNVQSLQKELALTEAQEKTLETLSERHAILLKQINQENAEQDQKVQDEQNKNNILERQRELYEEIVKAIKNRDNYLNDLDKDDVSQELKDQLKKNQIPRENEIINAKTQELFGLSPMSDDIKKQISIIDLATKKWIEQKLITKEVGTEIDKLKLSLLNITNGEELKNWRTQWEILSNSIAVAKVEQDKLNEEKKDEDNQIQKKHNEDLSRYIELIKLRNSYEQKAAKEEPNSRMNLFYLQEQEKVQERIGAISDNISFTEKEQNDLNEIELQQQMKLDEIIRRRAETAQIQNDKDAGKKLYNSQEEEIQKRFEFGYIGEADKNQWEQELAKYRNYLTGVTNATDDETAKQKELISQLYDRLIKLSNASKSFYTQGGKILEGSKPDVGQLGDEVYRRQALKDTFDQLSDTDFQGARTKISGFGKDMTQLNFIVDSGKGILESYRLELNRTTGEFQLIQTKAQPAMTLFQRIGQNLKRDFTGLFSSFIGGSVIYKFAGAIRSGISEVRNLDLALTELKKVTDETDEVYEDFLNTASQTATKIGSTMRDFTQATAEFAKLGYSISQASEMAEAALVYKNVGDGINDVTMASESIISTLKGFNLEASQSIDIVSMFNEVGNRFAITSKGIGDALQVSASALSAGGNTLAESIGLITAANSVVQNPNTVGK